jgi:EAL domain-containing protein (putative c-di-GMP-specific phosphodiesterase class I)
VISPSIDVQSIIDANKGAHIMDVNIRLTGLDELLGIIYGVDARLSTLLSDLGFESSQVEHLQNGHLDSVVNQFLSVIHGRLTSASGRDTYYEILSRRYGLDGAPPQQLSAIAEQRNLSPQYLRQLFEEIIQRCRSKTWQIELRKSLKYIVIQELDNMQQRPTKEQVEEKLERLSSLRNAVEFTRLDYETRRKEILKQIQSELDALDFEYTSVLEAAQENIAALEKEIKTDVLLYGGSVSGGMYRAVYTHGRVSWDNDGMARYAALHPEVLQFRKQSQPVVSLRVMDRN